MQEISDKHGGKIPYSENHVYKAWLREVRSINCLPALEILQQFCLLLGKARNLFNDGKRGRGRKGSIMALCSNVHRDVGKIYIDGSHSSVDSLSWFERPELRNNQAMEQAHTATIKLGDASTYSARGSFERWIDVAKKTRAFSCE